MRWVVGEEYQYNGIHDDGGERRWVDERGSKINFAAFRPDASPLVSLCKYFCVLK